eukprot:3929081-Amphidinium_carterae.1
MHHWHVPSTGKVGAAALAHSAVFQPTAQWSHNVSHESDITLVHMSLWQCCTCKKIRTSSCTPFAQAADLGMIVNSCYPLELGNVCELYMFFLVPESPGAPKLTTPT